MKKLLLVLGFVATSACTTVSAPAPTSKATANKATAKKELTMLEEGQAAILEGTKTFQK